MSNQKDLELVKKFCEDGDKNAFEQIYEKHFNAVFRFVYSRVGKREIVEDIVSETFLTFIDSIQKYNGKSQLKTFIIGISLNKIRQYSDQRKKLKTIQLDQGYPVFEEDVTEVDEQKEGELASMLRKVLSKLPKKYSAVLTERFIKGNSIKESAKNLDLTEANLRVIQTRAIKKATQFANELINNL